MATVANSTYKLIPDKLTTAQIAALSAESGAIVYDTDLSQLKHYDGSTWMGLSLNAATNQIGNTAKTSYNRLSGYTKIDYRPTVCTNSYALQVRSEPTGTSGQFWGVDAETHLQGDGTASIRSVQGVAVVDTGFTGTASTLIGVYGQARADGTVAGASFMTGLYGLIEASAAITATHVTSCWLDSHQANAVTGEHDLLYMTNNGAAQMDQAIYLYGGDKITSLIELNTVSGMVSDTAEVGGTAKKIKITIDGTVHYINAYTG